MACYNANDCISFTFDIAKSVCHFYVGTTEVGKAEPVCPNGVGNGYQEIPGYPMRPGHYGHEYGPCLGGAAKGQELDLQGNGNKGDQQILELPREEHGGESGFEVPSLELRRPLKRSRRIYVMELWLSTLQSNINTHLQRTKSLFQSVQSNMILRPLGRVIQRSEP
ncbi:MAG: hypothetical protein Q9217_001055 [Psora testacea]